MASSSPYPIRAWAPQPGETAPDFELPDSTGAPRRLADLCAASPLVLVFYRGHWWPFCHRQLADYRDHEGAIRLAGATVAAISVDSADKSQAVRDELHLNFPILCDVHRRVVREWGVYNAREKGGIAKPAVFVVDPGRVVRYVSVDEVASRVPASEVVSLLSAHDGAPAPHRRRVIPRPGNFFRAVRHSIEFGVRQPESETK